MHRLYEDYNTVYLCFYGSVLCADIDVFAPYYQIHKNRHELV